MHIALTVVGTLAVIFGLGGLIWATSYDVYGRVGSVILSILLFSSGGLLIAGGVVYFPEPEIIHTVVGGIQIDSTNYKLNPDGTASIEFESGTSVVVPVDSYTITKE